MVPPYFKQIKLKVEALGAFTLYTLIKKKFSIITGFVKIN